MSSSSLHQYKLRDCISDVVDNRARNPHTYFLAADYPVIDNYLIQNTIYPDLRKSKDTSIRKDSTILRDYLENT